MISVPALGLFLPPPLLPRPVPPPIPEAGKDGATGTVVAKDVGALACAAAAEEPPKSTPRPGIDDEVAFGINDDDAGGTAGDEDEGAAAAVLRAAGGMIR